MVTPFAAAVLFVASLGCDAVAEDACTAPDPVCAVRGAVFMVSAFDPLASAVRIAPSLLVTNRHVVADVDTVTIVRPDGRTVAGTVVPTAYDGDLALVESGDLGDGPIFGDLAEADAATDLYTVAVDDALRIVRAYAPGRPLIAIAGDAPRPRLHHGAYSQSGNSGGALVDARGRLVGIVASGGEGRFEAMPSHDIALLLERSGAQFQAADEEMGEGTRVCVETIEGSGRGVDDAMEGTLVEACVLSANRQLIDLAAQVLGRSRRLDTAAALLATSLERDPNALNTRVSIATTYMFMQRFDDAAPHVAFLVDHLPGDPAILRLAIQVGARTGDRALLDRALLLIEQYHPDLIDWAERLLDAMGLQ